MKDFADAFKSKYDRLDVLVNNAGEYVPENDTTEDGFEVCCHLANYIVNATELSSCTLRAIRLDRLQSKGWNGWSRARSLKDHVSHHAVNLPHTCSLQCMLSP